MPVVCWDHGSDGWYVIDMLITGQRHACRVDTGLVDRFGEVGLELNPSYYDGCLRTNRLTPMRRRERLDAGGRRTLRDCGIVQAQLFDPVQGIGVGRAHSFAAVQGLRVGPGVNFQAGGGYPGPTRRWGWGFFPPPAGRRGSWGPPPPPLVRRIPVKEPSP